MNIKKERRAVITDDVKIEYNLVRKNVKNINMRVKADCEIHVSANPNTPADYIDKFVASKSGFIARALEKYSERKKYELKERQYTEGECFRFLGKELRLEVRQADWDSVYPDGEYLYLCTRDENDIKKKEKLVLNWFKAQAGLIFDEICRKIYSEIQGFVVSYPVIKTRRMKSMWGSCRPKKGVITLNIRLIEAPEKCIEYVVLHEFAHFVHPNHSRDFYAFIEKLMPDWKERKTILDKIY